MFVKSLATKKSKQISLFFSETVLGVKMNSHENQEEPLLKAFEIVSSLIAERMLQPWLQPDSVYKLLSCHFRFEKNKKVLHDFVNKVSP